MQFYKTGCGEEYATARRNVQSLNPVQKPSTFPQNDTTLSSSRVFPLSPHSAFSQVHWGTYSFRQQAPLKQFQGRCMQTSTAGRKNLDSKDSSMRHTRDEMQYRCLLYICAPSHLSQLLKSRRLQKLTSPESLGNTDCLLPGDTIGSAKPSILSALTGPRA